MAMSNPDNRLQFCDPSRSWSRADATESNGGSILAERIGMSSLSFANSKTEDREPGYGIVPVAVALKKEAGAAWLSD